MHRAALDGKTLFMFLKSWAHLCKHEPDTLLPDQQNHFMTEGAFVERKGLLGEDGFSMAVNAISEAIKGLDNGVLNGAENLVSSLYLSEFDLQATTDYSRVFTTAGSHQFKMYDTDFGWGRPKSTEVVPIGRRGAITFSDGKNGGGAVDIGLVLKKHHMEVFASLFHKKAENNLPASAPPASVPEASAPTSTSTPEGNDTNEEVEGYSVYIRNLPLNVTADKLEEEFKKFGPIKQGGIQVRNKKLQGYCFGIVEFLSASFTKAPFGSRNEFEGKSFSKEWEMEGSFPSFGNAGKSKSSSWHWTRVGRVWEKKWKSSSWKQPGRGVGSTRLGRPELGPEGDDVMVDARLASALPHSNFFYRNARANV
ncbi:hypothetical protein L3X38_020073 [Prunus dulcis]|uniref:RRM domain-containing protein n=1 Tax=Prunus dulcis TaxID=3755 RepID=A0AAD4WCC4_PRUDU|nr:hypothetical protein L3X38_020073 [Prunus dulcis]